LTEPTAPVVSCLMSPILSVVVPCFNEAEVIHATHVRLKDALSRMGASFEIIYVNDGSKDNTAAELASIQAKDATIRLINFARNFGHQAAVSAGLQYAAGAAIVIIDADLQDPPELIGTMLDKWREGFQVVYGQRVKREGETAFKKFTANFFYRALNAVSDTAIPRDTGDFRLIDRRIADVLNQMPERHRFLRGMVSWVGFKQYALQYDRAPRLAGETKYPLRKMLRFATHGIVSFSTAPLKLSIWLGMLSACCAVLLIIYAVTARLLTHQWVSGWAATIFAIAFFGGVQLVATGVIGIYIGSIFEEVKGRPLFVIDSVSGFPASSAKETAERYTGLSATRAGLETSA
jgi:glycosyltransferase involved in cell wall biosynthesis